MLSPPERPPPSRLCPDGAESWAPGLPPSAPDMCQGPSAAVRAAGQSQNAFTSKKDTAEVQASLGSQTGQALLSLLTEQLCL